MLVRWDGGEGERIPAWATRVVQDEKTKIFLLCNPHNPAGRVWSKTEMEKILENTKGK